MFEDMARHKVIGRNMQPRDKAKGITINKDAVASRANTTNLLTSGGKGNFKAKAPASPEKRSYTDASTDTPHHMR